MSYDENNGSNPGPADPDEPTCPDLAGLFGNRFKIGRDEAYACEHGEHGRFHDPWLLLVPCRFGRISPWTETELAASVDAHPNIAAAIRKLPFTRIVQDGDHGELTAAFTVDHFDKVAEIMRPHRRRQWTDEQRQELSERMTQNIAADSDRWAPPAKMTAENAEQISNLTQPNPIA